MPCISGQNSTTPLLIFPHCPPQRQQSALLAFAAGAARFAHNGQPGRQEPAERHGGKWLGGRFGVRSIFALWSQKEAKILLEVTLKQNTLNGLSKWERFGSLVVPKKTQDAKKKKASRP